MYEYVLVGVGPVDEAIAVHDVEPFHGADHTLLDDLLLLDGLLRRRLVGLSALRHPLLLFGSRFSVV
jgi:hypothetical protein